MAGEGSVSGGRGARWVRAGGMACLVLLALCWTVGLSWQATFGEAGLSAWSDPGLVVYTLAAFPVLAALLLWAGALRTSDVESDGDRAAGRAAGSVVLVGGLTILWAATAGTEYVGRPNYWHGSEFYVVSAAVFPALLVALARASDGRYVAVCASLVYLAMIVAPYASLLVLSPSALVGTSEAGATHFVLPHVPMLLVVPALGIDSIVDRLNGPRSIVGRLARVGILGATFVTLHLGAHWPAATVLVPRMDGGLLARTWPRGAEAMSYATQFWNLDPGTIPFVTGLAVAGGLATVSAGVGLWIGARLRR